MTLGEIVDFCISYNERMERAEKEAEKEKKTPRKATAADIQAYFG